MSSPATCLHSADGFRFKASGASCAGTSLHYDLREMGRFFVKAPGTNHVSLSGVYNSRLASCKCDRRHDGYGSR